MGDKLKSGFLFNNPEEKLQRRVTSLVLYRPDREENKMEFKELKSNNRFVLFTLLDKLIAQQTKK